MKEHLIRINNKAKKELNKFAKQTNRKKEEIASIAIINYCDKTLVTGKLIE